MIEIKLKRCPMCCVTKTSTEFFKNKRDGTSPYCKPCSAERKRKGNKTRQQIHDEIYPSEDTKICSKCKSEKLRTEFNTRIRNGETALKPYCKECQKLQFKTWASKTGKQKHKSVAERNEFLKKNRYPCKDQKLCSGCDKVKHKEEFGHRFKGGLCKKCRSKQEADNYQKNKEIRREKARLYRKSNLEMVREYARNGFKRRRAAKLGVISTLTTNEWIEIMKKYNGKCLCCGSSEKISIDHIIPISKGGGHVADNVQPLCISCNSSKSVKTIDYRKTA